MQRRNESRKHEAHLCQCITVGATHRGTKEEKRSPGIVDTTKKQNRKEKAKVE